MTNRLRVVVVEDDILIACFLADLCRELGADLVGTAHDGEAACTVVLGKRPDYVLMDVRLGKGIDGVDAALTIAAEMPECRIIYITGSSEPQTLQRIKDDHPYRTLIKPVSRAAVANALGLDAAA